MTISKENSQKIKNMSLLCAAFVVSIHIGLNYGLESSTWFVSQFLRGIANIAVPFFFVVSGFFLAEHSNKKGWWQCEVKKRIVSLGVPFFIWSFLFLVITMKLMPLAIFSNLIARRPLGTNIHLLEGVDWFCLLGVDLTTYPAHVPLWYLRCLFLLILASPLIVFFTSKLRFLWLIFCFALVLIRRHIPNPELNEFLRVGFALRGLFYFSIGIFIQKNRNLKTTKKWAIISAIGGLCFLVMKIVCFYYSWKFQTLLGTLSTPFLLYAIWHFIPSKHWPDCLTSCSFPIYLMHVLFFPYIHFVINKLHIHVVSDWFLPMLRLVVGFCGSIVVANLLRRFTPRFARVIFGGR